MTRNESAARMLLLRACDAASNSTAKCDTIPCIQVLQSPIRT
jgi:hypothetical protein